MKFLHFSNFISLLFAFIGTPAYADESHDWLLKIDRAARTLSYEGVFIYRHGDMLETMRIVHNVDNGKVRERLVSLNGAQREITRTDREVRCYLTAENPLVFERADRRFPSILPDRVGELHEHYDVQLGKTSRVAGHPAQAITIKPKDSYRYGYHLWADIKSGLLLRADLVDDKNKIIEQFMFTQLTHLGSASTADEKSHERRNKDRSASTTMKPTWAIERLPPGFKLSMYSVRQISTKPFQVEHLVYSDGWAVVSVFIERLQDKVPQGGSAKWPLSNRHDRLGAVHTYARVSDRHRITVVGEVPAATIDMMGQSAKFLP